MLDAAAHGLGIALARPPLTVDQLASGRIVAADERTALNPVSYWMDRPAGRPGPQQRNSRAGSALRPGSRLQSWSNS